jgi:hypothetical protein
VFHFDVIRCEAGREQTQGKLAGELYKETNISPFTLTSSKNHAIDNLLPQLIRPEKVLE